MAAELRVTGLFAVNRSEEISGFSATKEDEIPEDRKALKLAARIPKCSINQ